MGEECVPPIPLDLGFVALRLQEVENLKQELVELRALALKGTRRPSTSSTFQVSGPSMHIHDSLGSGSTRLSMKPPHDCLRSVSTTGRQTTLFARR